MAAITKLKLLAAPSSSSTGTEGTTYNAQWECSVDAVLPGKFVERLAQQDIETPIGSGNPNPLPATNPDGTKVTEVPNIGHRFMMRNGDIVEDTGQTATAFMALANDPYIDEGALALDFETTPLEGGCDRDWMIDVTWRAPQPGANERPAQIAQLNPTLNNAIPVSNALTSGGNSVERWMEYRTVRYLETQGHAILPTNVPATAKTLMVMPNGEAFEPIEREAVQQVLVISRNVASPRFATDLNNTYERTMNNAIVNFGGFNAAPHTAVYESTRTGRPISKRGSTYFRAETRIILFHSVQFLYRQALGTYYRSGTQYKVNKSEDGFEVLTTPLKADGTLATTNAEIANVGYALNRPVSYAPFAFTNW